MDKRMDAIGRKRYRNRERERVCVKKKKKIYIHCWLNKNEEKHIFTYKRKTKSSIWNTHTDTRTVINKWASTHSTTLYHHGGFKWRNRWMINFCAPCAAIVVSIMQINKMSRKKSNKNKNHLNNKEIEKYNYFIEDNIKI